MLEGVRTADLHPSPGHPILEDLPACEQRNPAGVGGSACLLGMEGAAPERPRAARLLPREPSGRYSGQGMGRRGLGRARPPWGAPGKGPGQLGRAQRSWSHHCTELHVLSCGSGEFPVGLNCWDEPSRAPGRGHRNGSRKGFWVMGKGSRKGSGKGERTPGRGSRKGLPPTLTAAITPSSEYRTPEQFQYLQEPGRSSQDVPAGNAAGISRLSQASLTRDCG